MKTKRTLAGLAMVALAAVVLAPGAANAGPEIDKGALGKYERHGRFVTLVREAPAAVHTQHMDRGPAATADTASGKLVERQGRMVKRTLQGKERAVSPAKAEHCRVVRHIKHIHRQPA